MKTIISISCFINICQSIMNQKRQILKLVTNKVNVIATNLIFNNVILMAIWLNESKSKINY